MRALFGGSGPEPSAAPSTSVVAQLAELRARVDQLAADIEALKAEHAALEREVVL